MVALCENKTASSCVMACSLGIWMQERVPARAPPTSWCPTSAQLLYETSVSLCPLPVCSNPSTLQRGPGQLANAELHTGMNWDAKELGRLCRCLCLPRHCKCRNSVNSAAPAAEPRPLHPMQRCCLAAVGRLTLGQYDLRRRWQRCLHTKPHTGSQTAPLQSEPQRHAQRRRLP